MGQKGVEVILTRDRIVVILVPCELEEEEIALPDPGKIRPLEERRVEGLEIVQPPVPEHHTQTIPPVTRMIVDVHTIGHPSAGKEDSAEAPEFSRRRILSPCDRCQSTATTKRDIAEPHLPRIVRKDDPDGSATRTEQRRAAQPELLCLRTVGTDEYVGRILSQWNDIGERQGIPGSIPECHIDLHTTVLKDP